MSTTTGSPRASLGTMMVAYTRLEAIEDLSYPLSTVFGQLTTLFPAILYYFLAALGLGGGRRADVGGDYYTFAIIGLATGVLLYYALGSFGRRLESAQRHGNFETMLVEPVPWIAVPFTMSTWRILLGSFSCALMLAIGGLFGANYNLAGIPAYIGVLVLGVLATTAIGTLSASIQILSKRGQPFIVAYSLAANLLGGAAFPVSLLPTWLEYVSYVIPHRHVIAAARSLIMAEPPAAEVSLLEALIYLLIFNVVAFAISLPLYSRCLQYAREHGWLSGY